MAIYHFTAKIISRSKGQSVVAAAAYRAAEKLFDARVDKHHNYRNKPHVVHGEINIPQHAPKWIKEVTDSYAAHKTDVLEKLWNSVEAHEKRHDAQLAREIEFALPIELNQQQAITLAREFINDQFVSLGMLANWNVHWEEHNPHVHVLLTLRELTETGFGKKVREWNQKEVIENWRAKWAEYVNFHLKLHQHNVRVDHRSYKDQGIDLVPGIHIGKTIREMEQRGIKTERFEEAQHRQHNNIKAIIDHPIRLLSKIIKRKLKFNHRELLEETVHHTQCNLTRHQIKTVIKTIEKHDVVFTERELAKVLLPYIHNAEMLVQAIQQIKSSPELISLGEKSNGMHYYTTRSMLKLELDCWLIAKRLHKTTHRKLKTKFVEKQLADYENVSHKKLTDEQRLAVFHLMKKSSLSVVVGRAGTGKSFLLSAAKYIWEKKGLRVLGITLSGIAADGLTKSSGIPSRTIESFRCALEKGTLILSKKDVIVMDEAGMTDNHAMSVVLKAVHKTKAKLVLVGDDAQLQPIGPGALFRAFLKRFGFAELQTIYRQKEEWQRTATHYLSQGNIKKGLETYYEKGCIHLEENETSAMNKLIDDWWQQSKNKLLSNNLLLAHRRKDVKVLNQIARDKRIQAQEITEGINIATSQGTLKFSEGDRVLFLKNDSAVGVKNGQFATLIAIKKNVLEKVTNLTVQLDGKSSQQVTFNLENYNHFTHGYAATVHKAQGVTVDNTFVFAEGNGWDKHLTYVAMTRHKQQCNLYARKDRYQNLEELQNRMKRSHQKNNVLDFSEPFAKQREINSSTHRTTVSEYLDENRKHREILEKFNTLEKALHNAEQQPYAYIRVAAKEALEKFAVQIAQDKSLLQEIHLIAPAIKKNILKILEQGKNLSL